MDKSSLVYTFYIRKIYSKCSYGGTIRLLFTIRMLLRM